MTAKRTLELVFAVLLAIALGLALNAWHNKGVDLAAMDATLKAQKNFQADLKSQSDLVVKDLKERMAALEQVKARATTPAQIVREIPTYLPPNLPAPVTTLTTPAPAGSPAGTPPTITGLQIPAVDMKPLFDRLVDYKECAAKLTAFEGQTSIDEDKIVSLEKERDAAVKAAKGGSVWSRVKHEGKWFLAGGILGGLLVAASKK